MSYSGGIITKPVSIRDVQQALGTSSTDLGTLCQNLSINKWAWYKPIVVPNVLRVITENERKARHYGLTPQSDAAALTLLRQDVSHSDIQTEFASARNGINEWGYSRPTGGLAAPYRLTDFVESPYSGEGRGDSGGYTNCGYKNNTKAPLVFGTEWEIGIEQLENVANNIIVQTGSTSNAHWTADPYTNTGAGGIDSGSATKGAYCYEGLRYQDYGARFGTASGQDINMSDSCVIPLNYILDSNLLNQDWRLGLIVLVKGISGNNVIPNDLADIFVSRYSLYSFSNSSNVAEKIQKFSVDMCTNQTLAYKMLAYVNAKGATTFDCIPVFAKFTTPTIYGGGTTQRTYQLLNGANATFYSIPTGDKTFSIIVTGKENQQTGSNVSKVTGNWTLKSMGTGQYTGNSSTPSSQRYPINNLVIIWTGSGTPTSGQRYTFSVDFDYQSYDGSNHYGSYTNDSIGYTGNNTITINGTSYYGVSLMGSPNIIMTTIRTFTVS